MILRIPKEQTVFLYQLLEGYEGLANYSTLFVEKGLGYRDIQLFIAPDLVDEFAIVLAKIKEEVDFIVIDNENGI